MKKGWKNLPIGEVCELVTRGIAPKYTEDGGTRVINQKCIRNHSIDYSLTRRNDSNIKNVPIERFIKVGDILVNSTGTGTLGRVAQVKDQPTEPTTVDTHVTILRTKSGIFINEFFGYCLIQIEEQLKKGGLGSVGQTELSRVDIQTKFNINFPTDHSEQRHIVAILDEAFEGLDRAKANAEANLINVMQLNYAYSKCLLASCSSQVNLSIGECLKFKSGDGLTKKEMNDGPFPVYGGNGVAGHYDKFNKQGTHGHSWQSGRLCGIARHISEEIWLTDNAFGSYRRI